MTGTMVRRMRSAGAALLASGAIILGAGAATADSAIENLTGKWTGQGALETSTGVRETVKCVVVYEVKSANTVINQNLRCASASYKIDALTQMKIAGTQVTGTWAESSFGTSGSVQSVTITGSAAGKPQEACIKEALMKAKVPAFAQDSFSATVTVRPN